MKALSLKTSEFIKDFFFKALITLIFVLIITMPIAMAKKAPKIEITVLEVQKTIKPYNSLGGENGVYYILGDNGETYRVEPNSEKDAIFLKSGEEITLRKSVFYKGYSIKKGANNGK